jgi:hypothetical protein
VKTPCAKKGETLSRLAFIKTSQPQARQDSERKPQSVLNLPGWPGVRSLSKSRLRNGIGGEQRTTDATRAGNYLISSARYGLDLAEGISGKVALIIDERAGTWHVGGRVNRHKIPTSVAKANLSPAQPPIQSLKLGLVERVKEFKAELRIQPL